jgi:putative photosynthetic complex assembly protein 2
VSALQLALPIVCALFVWWFSTGLILFAVNLPQHTYRWTLAAATLALGLAVWGLSSSASDATETGAYVAFASAIVVWGWQEVCFLTGAAIGPRTEPCPPGLGGWRRVAAAIHAILFHELLLLALAAIVVFATSGGANQVGFWTYVVLWTMRLSAKLNLFLGVPFTHDGWLPANIKYLRSFFRVGPINYLFPVAVSAATVVAFLLARRAGSGGAGAFEAVGCLLLAALTGLAVLEHWFMVLPLPVDAVWAWALKMRRRGAAIDTSETLPAATVNGGST